VTVPLEYQCHARRKHVDEKCQMAAMKGQKVCKVHGGMAKQNRLAAERRMKEEEARVMLAERTIWDQNAAPTKNAVEELAELSGKLREAVATIGARLEPKNPCVCCGLDGLEADAVNSSALRILVKEYRTVLSDLAKLGIEDRRIKLEEAKIFILVEALRAGLVAIDAADEVNEIVFREAAILRVAELEARPDIVWQK